MTDFHSMTDQEVNEEIAKKKEWSYSLHFGTPLWEHPETGVMVYHHAPDYTRYWNLAGGLLEQMAINGDSGEEGYNEVNIWRNFGDKKWNCEISCFLDPFTADTPQCAIFKAFLEWSENNVRA